MHLSCQCSFHGCKSKGSSHQCQCSWFQCTLEYRNRCICSPYQSSSHGHRALIHIHLPHLHSWSQHSQGNIHKCSCSYQRHSFHWHKAWKNTRFYSHRGFHSSRLGIDICTHRFPLHIFLNFCSPVGILETVRKKHEQFIKKITKVTLFCYIEFVNMLPCHVVEPKKWSECRCV